MASKGAVDPKTIIEMLQRLESQVPDFAHLTNAQIIAFRRAATLRPEWIETAVNAVGASEAVAGSIGSTYEELRQEIGDVPRWEEVEQALRAFLKGVASANLVRRHRIGLKALQVYGICRQLVRQPEHAQLLPYVEKMKEMNKLGRRKPKETGEGAP